MDYEDSRLDEIDKMYEELDELVELARASDKSPFGDMSFKYVASLAMVNLMMEEVNPTDIRIYQQMGDSWIAEVKYKGIVFICIAGKYKPEEWEGF